MKKIYSIIFVGILIISGYSVFAKQNQRINQDDIIITFSKLEVIENDNHISLELEGTNSILLIISPGLK